GSLMDAALAPGLEFEVLDGIGDIDARAVDTDFLYSSVKHLSRRSDERPPRQILLIAGLFTHKHHLGMLGALPENGLGGVLVKRAALAALHGTAGIGERGDFGCRINHFRLALLLAQVARRRLAGGFFDD